MVRDEGGRIGVRTRDKVNMASRLQYLLSDGDRLCLTSPFIVGNDNLHTDKQSTPVTRVLTMISKQLSAMRRVNTERSGSTIRTTVTGKGEQGRWNDDLAMCFIIGTHCMQKWKQGAYEQSAKFRFTK